MSAIADAFLKNRADNLPDDVSQEFIVPHFFQEISIFSDTKSVRILGGRGCGKTMLLRYFCHGSSFSQHRKSISDDEFSSIGLYFRPDTGFCSLMTPAWLSKGKDGLAFSHYLTLSLVSEACQAIRTISSTKNFENGSIDLTGVEFDVTLAKQLNLPKPTFNALEQLIKEQLADFDLWVRNPDSCSPPRFVHFTNILEALAADLSKHSPRLRSLAFRVFIDEFENLLPKQREVVCDEIKHPKQRVAVHIAHKREAVTDFKTSSEERIVETHDIRTIDIERLLSKRDEHFELLAAELFLLRLYQVTGKVDCHAFNPELLHDASKLHLRLVPAYKKAVIDYAKQILPEKRAPEIARDVLQDLPLRKRVIDFIQKGLELQGLAGHVVAESLINEDFAEATVVLGAILNRKNATGKAALKLFYELIENGKTPHDVFYKSGGWVDNNLYGCLFHLYSGLPKRPNILYSGFSRFCKIASPNLRFFQELCHNTLLLAYQRQSSSEISDPITVSQDIQAQASQQVSDAMFEDIMQLGQHGDRLLDLTRRLGSLFEGYNKLRSQSEPEINHFSINTADSSQLSDDAQNILREAKIWSVLWETGGTKNKDKYDASQYELGLNTIYAPHFKISYRKRRKVTLTTDQLDIILTKSDNQFKDLLKQLFESQNDTNPIPQTGQLF